MGSVVIYQKQVDGDRQEIERIDGKGARWMDIAPVDGEIWNKKYFHFNWRHGDAVRPKTGESVDLFTLAYWKSEASYRVSSNDLRGRTDLSFAIAAGQRRSIDYEVKGRHYTLIVEHQFAGKERR